MNRIAEKLARKVKTRRQRHSCLILKGGRILSQANNEKGHAEQIALDIYPFDDRDPVLLGHGYEEGMYKGCVLISFRIAPNGSIGKSRPCRKCQRAINIAGIRKIIYHDGYVWRDEYP